MYTQGSLHFELRLLNKKKNEELSSSLTGKTKIPALQDDEISQRWIVHKE